MTWRLRGAWLVIFIGLQGCSGSGGDSSVVACLPSAVPDICITNEQGTYNGLGVHKFMRFSVAGSRLLNISARCVTGVNTDPDLVLFKNGQRVAFAESTAINQENMSVNVEAGDYVLEITDYRYHSDGPVSQSCFDIDIEIAGMTPLNKTQFDDSVPVVSKTVSNPILQAPPSTCNTTGQISVAGTATYDLVPHNLLNNSLDYTSITQEPIRGAVVEVWCDNAVYSSGVTSPIGAYTLDVPNGQDFFVRVKAQMLQTGTPSWNFRVVDNTSSGALYSMVSSVFNSASDIPIPNLNALSGWGISSYTSTRVAAPFAILDSVYLALKKVLVESPLVFFPALNINWSINNVPVSGNPAIGQIDTSHFNGTAIYILGAANDDIDEYDDHVVIHEWGHYFEYNFSRADNIGGSHSGGDVLDIRVAFGEGFGNALSAIVTDDPQYSDASGLSQAGGFGFNLETNTCSNSGWFSECSVQSILYDLYDDDIAITNDADGISLGFSPLYSVLVNQQKNTAAMTSVFSFIKLLKDSVDVPTATNIDNLISNQGIDAVTDIYGDSQITNNPGNYDQLPVYVHFQ